MKYKGIISIIALVVVVFSSGVLASPMTAYHAEKVVTGWLKADAEPLGAKLGGQIESIEIFTGDDGEPVYYIVYLQPVFLLHACIIAHPDRPVKKKQKQQYKLKTQIKATELQCQNNSLLKQSLGQ